MLPSAMFVARNSQERPTLNSICESILVGLFEGNKNIYVLFTHLLQNKGERPFVCELCGSGFKQKHSLKDHYKTHTGERPFKCLVCLKRFSMKHNLVSHVRSMHVMK